MDAFRTKKETIKAQYSAAEAQTRVNEAFTGLSDELGDVGQAIARAEDKTAQLQARAGAVDELLASGALDDPSGTFKDDITRELDAMASSASVEDELAAMKTQLGLAAGPTAAPAPQLEQTAQAAPDPQAAPAARTTPEAPAEQAGSDTDRA